MRENCQSREFTNKGAVTHSRGLCVLTHQRFFCLGHVFHVAPLLSVLRLACVHYTCVSLPFWVFLCACVRVQKDVGLDPDEFERFTEELQTQTQFACAFWGIHAPSERKGMVGVCVWESQREA